MVQAQLLNRKSLIIWWLVIIGVALIVGGQISAENPYDDAFITYRYAANFRDGLRLLYNTNEWVLGTTTPLYALLLGIVGKIVPNIVIIGYLVTLLSWIVASLLASALLWQAKFHLSAYVAPLLLILHPAIPDSFGMETPLVLALMLGSAVAWLGNRRVIAIVCLAALILTRQDGALWAIFLGLELWRRDKRLPLAETIGVIVLTLPWFGYAWWRYGSPLPNSAAAKIGQGGVMGLGGEETALWQFVADFGRIASTNSLLLLFVILIAAILGLNRKTWWLTGWLCTYLLIYSSLGVISFPWYFVPPLAILWVLVALGWSQQSPLRWLAVGLGVICVVGFSNATWQRLQNPPARFRPAYRPAGEWLANNTLPDATVAAVEIGAIGYFSNRPIIDTMGLVTPAMTDHLFGWLETVVYATQQFEPDYIVVPRNTAWEWMTLNWWFNYEVVADFADGDVTIYQRQPTAPTTSFSSNAVFGEGIVLESAEVVTTTLTDQTLDLWLNFVTVNDQMEDNFFDLALVDPVTFERIGATALFPFDGGYTTQFWRTNDRLRVPARLLPPELPAGGYQIGVGWQDDFTQVGWLRAGNPPLIAQSAELISHSVQLAWQNGLHIDTIALPATIPSGSTLPIYLLEYTNTPIAENWTRFIHLINSDSELVAQFDTRPHAGRWPTTIWKPNETVTSLISIPLPENMAEGNYGLRIGWYAGENRLPLSNGVDFVELFDLLQIDK